MNSAYSSRWTFPGPSASVMLPRGFNARRESADERKVIRFLQLFVRDPICRTMRRSQHSMHVTISDRQCRYQGLQSSALCHFHSEISLQIRSHCSKCTGSNIWAFIEFDRPRMTTKLEPSLHSAIAALDWHFFGSVMEHLCPSRGTSVTKRRKSYRQGQSRTRCSAQIVRSTF
jgi:hypothetical protein